MDDAAIAATMRAKDPAGLAEAYRAYADRLFTYCASMLRDRDAAADAVHDTFIIAADRIGQLREHDRLRSWLYAIARNECLRIMRVRGRTTALDEASLESVGAVTDETVDPDSGVRQEELITLVWTAAEGLNPREREVLDLSLRHRLDGPELAAAMGVSPNSAAAVLSKARQQLERALAALIVARTGRRDCVTLDGLLAGWDGAITVLLRKRVARHIESCTVCSERKRRDVNAAALLGTTPMLVAPPVLRERVLGGYDDVELVSYHAEIAKRAGRFNRDGFPNPLDMPRMIFGWRAPAVAAAGVAALMVGGIAVFGGTTDAAIVITPSPSVSAPASLPTGNPIPPSPRPTTTPAPTVLPTVPPTVTPTPTPTTNAPPPLTSPEPDATPTPPSTPEPPPPLDLIVIYCDPDLANECDSLTMIREQATAWIATESVEPVEVLATPTSRWLVVSPSAMVTGPDRPVQISFSLAGEPGCPARVAFTIPGTDEVETFTVVHDAVPPCITS